MRKRIALLYVVIFLIRSCVSQEVPNPKELNTVMMESTFRMVGANNNAGTAFIVGRRVPNTNSYRYTLVTAAHVVKDMPGDTAFLLVRLKSQQGNLVETPYPIQIRSGERPLWVQHPNSDVAVMYVTLPNDAVPTIVPEELLADDKELLKYEIHPGDDLNVLGYPLGFASPGGYPILRSGKIASYPLVPQKEHPFFYLDFRVFKGNSGGPVYLISYNRTYSGSIHMGWVTMLMGLVSEEISATEQFQGVYETRSQSYPLSIAKIVPSGLIREALQLLPTPSLDSTPPASSPTPGK